MDHDSSLSEMAALPGLWGPDAPEITPSQWEGPRRAQILDRFATEIYGRTPEGGGVSTVAELSRDDSACGGRGSRSELAVTLEGPLGSRSVSLLLSVPTGASRLRPAPLFLGLNFRGNHSTTDDPAVRLSSGRTRELAQRGSERHRWPVEMILDRGYAVATAHYSELEPDFPGAAEEGVRGLFDKGPALGDSRAPDAWGAVGAWAWGLSRMLDVLRDDARIDGSRVIVHGHSRLGKAALWASAQDARFAATISNDSGCAGASLFRHAAGESIAMITSNFPHWFAGNFDRYRGREGALPVDQHHLLAALCPRPIHIASASQDHHADPRGEYLSTLHASPIMELFGHRGTLVSGWSKPGCDLATSLSAALPSPPVDTRVGERLSYHVRSGGHDVLADDWKHFLDFADHNLATEARRAS